MSAALVAAALVVACGGKSSETAQAEATPEAVSLGANDIATAVSTTLRTGAPLSGPLEPKVDVTVGSPIAEQIVEMLVNEGTPVRQGQTLARFRDDVLRANEASARADLANTQMAVTLAAAESTRAEALFAEGAIARRDRDNAMLAVEASRARLALVRAQVAGAADRMETATLKAPVSGVVSQRFAQAGDRVDFGKPVVSIVDTRVLQLEASVEAQWLNDLRVGRPVALTMAQLPGDTIEGRIARISPTADPATRQVRVYVDVPNPSGRLVGGLFVSGRVLMQEAREAVAVPRVALRYEGAERTPVVYVVVNDVVSRREVGVGLVDLDRNLAQIVSGVNAGDLVIVGPVEGLADGTRVDIAGRPASAPGTDSSAPARR